MSKAAFAGLKAVQEIRFHLCQTSKGSEGVRNFLLKSYKKMKAASPATPILIREASGVQGGMVARYGTSRTSDSTSKRTRRTRGVRARSRSKNYFLGDLAAPATLLYGTYGTKHASLLDA